MNPLRKHSVILGKLNVTLGSFFFFFLSFSFFFSTAETIGLGGPHDAVLYWPGEEAVLA